MQETVSSNYDPIIRLVVIVTHIAELLAAVIYGLGIVPADFAKNHCSQVSHTHIDSQNALLNEVFT